MLRRILLSVACGAVCVTATLVVAKPPHPEREAMVALCAFPPGSDLERVEATLDDRITVAETRRAALEVHWAPTDVAKATALWQAAAKVGVYTCPLADAYAADQKQFQYEYAMLCAYDPLERPPPTSCDMPNTFAPPQWKQRRVPADQFLTEHRYRTHTRAARALIDRTLGSPPNTRAKVWQDAPPPIPTCFLQADFAYQCPLADGFGSAAPTSLGYGAPLKYAPTY